MKIIKSESYMKKEAILSLPVGDPELPGNLDERDINRQFEGSEEDIAYGQEGQTDLHNYSILYTYDYDYNKNAPTKIKPIKAKAHTSGQVITDSYDLDILVQGNEELIKKDIENFEEDAKIERRSGYNIE